MFISQHVQIGIIIVDINIETLFIKNKSMTAPVFPTSSNKIISNYYVYYCGTSPCIYMEQEDRLCLNHKNYIKCIISHSPSPA